MQDLAKKPRFFLQVKWTFFSSELGDAFPLAFARPPSGTSFTFLGIELRLSGLYCPFSCLPRPLPSGLRFLSDHAGTFRPFIVISRLSRGSERHPLLAFLPTPASGTEYFLSFFPASRPVFFLPVPCSHGLFFLCLLRAIILLPARLSGFCGLNPP